MKKLAYFVLFIIIIAVALQLITSNIAKNQLDTYIQTIENMENISVQSKDIKHNIFGTDIDLKVMAKIMHQDIEFDINGTNTYILLPSFSKASGTLSVTKQPYAQVALAIFGTQTPMSFNADLGFSKSHLSIQIAPLNIIDEAKLSIQGSSASADIRGDKLKKLDFKAPNILLEDLDGTMQILGFEYFLNYDEPIAPSELMKVRNSNGGLKASSVALSTLIFNLSLSEPFNTLKLVDKGDKYDIISTSGIKKLDILGLGLEDIALELGFTGLDSNASEYFASLDEQSLQNGLLASSDIAKLFDNKSTFLLKNFSFKANGGEAKLSLKITLDSSYTSDKISTLDDYLLISGELNATKPISAMLGAWGEMLKANEQEALASGMLKASNEGYTTTFSMDKNKLLINGVEQDLSFLGDDRSSEDAKFMTDMYEGLQQQ